MVCAIVGPASGGRWWSGAEKTEGIRADRIDGGVLVMLDSLDSLDSTIISHCPNTNRPTDQQGADKMEIWNVRYPSNLPGKPKARLAVGIIVRVGGGVLSMKYREGGKR